MVPVKWFTRSELCEVMASEIRRGQRKSVFPGFGFHVYVDLDKAAERMRLARAEKKQWKTAVTVGLQALAEKKRAQARAFFGM